MKSKVSIIIPTYNSMRYIERCIDSILRQSYKSIEVIVVDDGSTDKTFELLSKKYSKEIKIYRQENSGVSAARNFGISVASGDYIMFADADDEFEKDAVEKAVKCALDNAVDVVRFSYKEKYANCIKNIDIGNMSDKKKVFDNKNTRTAIDMFFGEKAYMKCLVMTLLIRKDYLIKNNIRFNPELYMMEDVVFYADLFRSKAKFYYLNEPLYIYYQNSNSCSHNGKKADKIIDGVLAANREMTKRFSCGDMNTINNKHLQIIINLATRKYLANRKSIDIKAIKELAKEAKFNDNITNEIIRNLIIKNQKVLFDIIIKLKALKTKVRGRAML